MPPSWRTAPAERMSTLPQVELLYCEVELVVRATFHDDVLEVILTKLERAFDRPVSPARGRAHFLSNRGAADGTFERVDLAQHAA